MGKTRRAAAQPGDFAGNSGRILPQVVPGSVVDYSRRDDHELLSVGFTAGLHIAFVLDEPERYRYISVVQAEIWQVSAAALLVVALGNLTRLSQDIVWQQVGSGQQMRLFFENFDGYDASRILLSRHMVGLAGRVAGRLVIGIPNRDYLVACGDYDPGCVEALQEQVRDTFDNHRYPITPELFTLEEGRIVPYQSEANIKRKPN